MQGLGHREGHRHAAARQGQHQGIRARVLPQLACQLPARVGTVGKGVGLLHGAPS